MEPTTLTNKLIKAKIVRKKDYSKVREIIVKHSNDWLNKLAKNPIINKDRLFKVVADCFGMPLYSYEKLLESKNVARNFPYSILKKHALFPVKISGKTIEFAVSNPPNKKAEELLKEELGREYKIKFALSEQHAIYKALDEGFGAVHAVQATSELLYRHEKDSAYKVLTAVQRKFLLIATALFFFWLLFDFSFAFILLFALVNLAYFLLNPVKFISIFLSPQSFKENMINVSTNEIASLDEEKLPVYTILVPLYKEAEVLPIIIDKLQKLDYPSSKKDIKIILEENDKETLRKAKEIGLVGQDPKYANFDVLIAPKADIQTKPRACNWAFLKARGDYVVIYDAEDRPESDQLKKALVAFNKSDPKTVCLQARLNFFNDKENMLTKWFCLEYTAWFDYYLPGLNNIGAPIPLGGTSNHFKAKYLKELGSWDPYNVTEDADLGLRIYRTTYKTNVLNSLTFEEANNNLWNWLRQRSRWEKGYLQTYLVQMRHPMELLKKLGLKKFMLLNVTFGANALIPLINPVLWAVSFVALALPWLLPPINSNFVYIISLINLTIGNLLFVILHLLALFRAKKSYLLLAALTMPVYWILISLGAWKGLIQLFTKPFYWEKTKHGITKVKQATQ